ncbi:MAG TPA: hypothetical protein VFU99_11415 [Gaiellaceae bacterium]|nr:hypothetical protein [Gaiellaceae bacterium]
MPQRPPEGELPGNNCYGQISAPSGLKVIAELLGTPGWSTRLRVSRYSGAEELQITGPGLEMETDPVRGGRHFLGGEVEPSERGRASLRHVSALLAEAGIAHRLELYIPETDMLLDHHNSARVARRRGKRSKPMIV